MGVSRMNKLRGKCPLRISRSRNFSFESEAFTPLCAFQTSMWDSHVLGLLKNPITPPQ